MKTVLRRVKDKRLTPEQERESGIAFALVAEGGNGITAKQLKFCLRTLGFEVVKGEAQTLVYEFDYKNEGSIGLEDFKKIFLAKTLERDDKELFDRAFNALDVDSTGYVAVKDLASALHATAREGWLFESEVCADLATRSSRTQRENEGSQAKTTIDADTLERCMRLQYYDKDIVGTMEPGRASVPSGYTTPTRVSKSALAAFLRLQ